MFNPDLEIDRLRWRLFDNGWTSDEVDKICNDARDEISDLILDIVANAVAEATDYATEIGAEDFIKEMTVIESGHSYMIWTLSGNTDFSVPEQKMLPHLLKNAEVAKDGSLYKVIPIKGKKMPTNIFEAMRERGDEIEATRAAIKARSKTRSAPANDMAEQFRQSLSQTIYKRGKSVADAEVGPVQFRTATNKQNANEDWVIPERNMDMTQFLMGINSRIESTVDDSVSIIIQSYEKEYL